MHKLLLGYDVEDINNFHQGELSIIICFGIFAGIANLSMSILVIWSNRATGDRKQWLNIVLRTKLDHYFEIQLRP